MSASVQSRFSDSDVQHWEVKDISFLQKDTGFHLSRHMLSFFRNKCSIDMALDLRAACIVEDGVVVAMWLYVDETFAVESYGTYVERKYRRQGLASLLWKSVPSRIKGVSCSNDGFKFLSAMKKGGMRVHFYDVRTGIPVKRISRESRFTVRRFRKHMEAAYEARLQRNEEALRR